MFAITFSFVVFNKSKIEHTNKYINFDVFEIELILNFNVVIDQNFNSTYLTKYKFLKRYEKILIFMIDVNFDEFVDIFEFKSSIF